MIVAAVLSTFGALLLVGALLEALIERVCGVRDVEVSARSARGARR